MADFDELMDFWFPPDGGNDLETSVKLIFRL